MLPALSGCCAPRIGRNQCVRIPPAEPPSSAAKACWMILAVGLAFWATGAVAQQAAAKGASSAGAAPPSTARDAGTFTASAVAPAGPAPAAEAAAPGKLSAPAQPDVYTVPAGTKVLLSLKSGINTKTARPGDGVYLVSTFPVVSGGRVLIPAGAYVQGVVDRVKRPGRIKGRAEINLHFTSIIFPDGQVAPIPGLVDSLPGSSGPKVGNEGAVEQAATKGHDAATIAKGAGIGAEGGAIGGAVGGHALAGIGYGSLAGAATGAIYTLFGRGPDINIPAGASVEMVLQRPMSLRAQYSATAKGQPTAMQERYDPLPQRAPLKKPNQP